MNIAAELERLRLLAGQKTADEIVALADITANLPPSLQQLLQDTVKIHRAE